MAREQRLVTHMAEQRAAKSASVQLFHSKGNTESSQDVMRDGERHRVEALEVERTSHRLDERRSLGRRSEADGDVLSVLLAHKHRLCRGERVPASRVEELPVVDDAVKKLVKLRLVELDPSWRVGGDNGVAGRVAMQAGVCKGVACTVLVSAARTGKIQSAA